jgi:hypothetical protein
VVLEDVDRAMRFAFGLSLAAAIALGVALVIVGAGLAD